MRPRLFTWLSPIVIAGACLRENPGFDGGAGETGASGSSTAGPGGSTGLVTTGPTTGPVTTGPTTGETSGMTAGTSSGSGVDTTMGVSGSSSSGAEQTSTGEASTGEASTGETGERPGEATLCGKPGPWQWSEPEALGMPVDSEAGDLDMWLGTTGLTLVWSSTRDGVQDTYRASRSAVGEPFVSAYSNNQDIGLSTPGEDGKLALSNDDKRAYLSVRPQGEASFRIHVGDRKGPSYEPLTPLPFDLPEYPNHHDPHISENDLRLYFAPAGGVGQMLVVATRPAAGEPFGAPQTGPFVNVDEPDWLESDPTLPAHELVLIYARISASEDGDADLWIATRADTNAPFGSPQPLTGINTDQHDTSGHLGRDGCELFFARSPVQDPAAWDIYRSEIQ